MSIIYLPYSIFYKKIGVLNLQRCKENKGDILVKNNPPDILFALWSFMTFKMVDYMFGNGIKLNDLYTKALGFDPAKYKKYVSVQYFPETILYIVKHCTDESCKNILEYLAKLKNK